MEKPTDMNAVPNPNIINEGGFDARVTELLEGQRVAERHDGFVQLRRRFAGIGLAAVALVGGTAIATSPNSDTSHNNGGIEQTMPSTVGEIPEGVVPSPEAAADWHAELISHFAGNQLAIGDQVDWTKHTVDRGAGAFSQDLLKGEQEIAAFHKSGTPAAKAAVASIMNSNLSPEDQARAIDGKGYVPVQVLNPADVQGNTMFKDGQVIVDAHRFVKSGDVFQMFTDSNGHLRVEVSKRADCGNGNVPKVVPVTPETSVQKQATTVPHQETTVPHQETTVTTTPNTTRTTTPNTTVTTTPNTTVTTTPNTTRTTTPNTTVTTTPNTTVTTEHPTTTLHPKVPQPPVPGGEDHVEAPVPGPSVPTTRLTPTSSPNTTQVPGGGTTPTTGERPPVTEAPIPIPTVVPTTAPEGPSGIDPRNIAATVDVDNGKGIDWSIPGAGIAAGIMTGIASYEINRRRKEAAKPSQSNINAQ